MPKSILSFTFLGTGHHRDTHPSALLGLYHDIQRYAQKKESPVSAWLMDGVGCAGSKEHPTPGGYIFRNGEKIVADKAVVSQWVHAFYKFMKRAYRALTGDGVEEILLEASLVLEAFIKEHGGLPKTVNLQGFSRGADSCVRFANIINRLHPEIEVNLFLIDPVPGPTRRDDPDSFVIPANVKDCRMTLMLNEHKSPFKPQHQGRYVYQNTQTRVSMNTLAGRHGAGLYSSPYGGISPLSTQALTQDAMLDFNMRNGSLPEDARITQRYYRVGTEFTSEPLKSPQGLLSARERFYYFCENMNSFKTLANRLIVKAIYYSRTIFKNREERLLHADLFLDDEHRQLCQEVFPAMFHWFFEKNTGSGGKKYSKKEVFQELMQLKQRKYRTFYDALLTHFDIAAINSVDDVIPPQGLACEIRLNYGQSLITDELSYLRHSLRSIADYYHYHWKLFAYLPMDIFEANRIRGALKKSLTLPNDQARALLVEVITNIKSRQSGGFIYQQVSTIIPSSEQFLSDAVDVLKTYLPKLSRVQAEVIRDAIALIQAERSDKSIEVYQQRRHVHGYLVRLHAEVIEMVRENPTQEALNDLSVSLARLSKRSYSETKFIDDIIRDLEGYLYWRSFLACFPTSFGWCHPEKLALAQEILDKLQPLKQSGNDLTQIKEILKEASLGDYKRKSKEGDVETFWNKQMGFKKDHLNTIIMTHLEKVTNLSSDLSHHLSHPATRYR